MQHTDPESPRSAGSEPQRPGRLQSRFGPREGARRTDPKSSGLGRVIIVVYGIFSLSAGVRSLYQILTQFDVAPLAYLLSLFSAAVYVVAAVALAKTGPGWHLIATGAVLVELIGVLGIGAMTFAAPELFADETVWSHFGQGYGYIPLLLPIVGLIWLRRTRPLTDRSTETAGDRA